MIKKVRISTPVAAQGQGQTSRQALLAFFYRIDIAQVIARAFCHGGLRHADCQPCLSQQWTKKFFMSSTYPSGWYITLTLLWADDAPAQHWRILQKKLQKTLPGPHQPLPPCAAQAARRLTQAALNMLDIARVVLQPYGYRPLRYFFLFTLSPEHRSEWT